MRFSKTGMQCGVSLSPSWLKPETCAAQSVNLLCRRTARMIEVVSDCRGFDHSRRFNVCKRPPSMVGRTRWEAAAMLPDTTLHEPFVRQARRDRTRGPARAMPLQRSWRYIGGLTPCVPTVTRGAAKWPCASLCAITNTRRPGCRSARVAGAKVTIAVRCGTCTVKVPPL